MKKTILAVILAATSFGSFAATGNLTFSGKVTQVCGMTLDKTAGGIHFTGDDFNPNNPGGVAPDFAEVTVSSNVSNGKVLLEMSNINAPDELGDVVVNAANVQLTDGSAVVDDGKTVKLYAHTPKSRNQLAAGDYTVTAVVKVTCE